MAPPLSAGFITISLLFLSFSRDRVSALERLLHDLGVLACSDIRHETELCMKKSETSHKKSETLYTPCPKVFF